MTPTIMLVVLTFYAGLAEPTVRFTPYSGTGGMAGCETEAAITRDLTWFDLAKLPSEDGKTVRSVLYSCELRSEETDEQFLERFRLWR